MTLSIKSLLVEKHSDLKINRISTSTLNTAPLNYMQNMFKVNDETINLEKGE